MTNETQLPHPITAMAAALPQCRNPKDVRFRLGELFEGRTKSGAPFVSPFSCGTQAVAYEADQMVKQLAEDEGRAIALEHRGLTERADIMRRRVASACDYYLATLGHFFADPIVCTCPDPDTTTS